MTRWQRFWFLPGGQLACAAARAALGVSLLLTLAKLGITDYENALATRFSASAYEPDGVLRFLGAGVPSAALMQTLHWVAIISASMLVLGIVTRLASIISLVSVLCLTTFAVSFAPGWPHQYPVVLVAHIALVFAPAGDRMSVDALLRRARGVSVARAGGYQWPLRLATLAVAFMYFNAFLHKMYSGGLRWAFSDNLRHHLLLRFDRLGVERTPLADWLLESPLHYQLAAFGNLVFQAAPIFAFFLFKRPWLRAACGVAFAVETLMLGLVMDLWNLHWLPLTALFIDWDRLSKGARLSTVPAPSPVASGYIAVFVAVLLSTGLVPQLDQTLRSFPFTRYPMFSKMRVKQPPDAAQSYEVIGNRIAVVAESVPEGMQARLDRLYEFRWLQRIRDAERFERAMALLDERLDRFGVSEARRALVHLVIFRVPARPEPARMDPYPVGLLAERDHGVFRMLEGRFINRGIVDWRAVGFSKEPDVVQWLVIRDDEPVAEVAPLYADGGRVIVPLKWRGQDSTLVLADVRVAGEVRRFVVARDVPIGW